MNQIDFLGTGSPIRKEIGSLPGCGIRTVAEEKVAARLFHDPGDQETTLRGSPFSRIYIGTVAVLDLPFVPDGGTAEYSGLDPVTVEPAPVTRIC